MSNYYNLPSYKVISVKGEDAEKFLQGQVSCDLSQLAEFYIGLFCDEKGYVITNATIFRNESFEIIVKNDLAFDFLKELERFSKFFKCEISISEKKIYGVENNGKFSKMIGEKPNEMTEAEWNINTLKNFCFDIDQEHSRKLRVNEIGYNFSEYVSYEKGCYRGQEIIARLTYLGKKNKKCVVFNEDYDEIHNVDNRKIGKKIFSINTKETRLSQFFAQEANYFSSGKEIKPIANQWA